MKGFRDIHSHFVYGVDDGARTREDMEAMLDAAHADGIASLVSTPLSYGVLVKPPTYCDHHAPLVPKLSIV